MFAMQMPYRFLNLSTAFQSDEIDGVFKKQKSLKKYSSDWIELGHQGIYENQSVGKENLKQCFVTWEIPGIANAD